MFRSLKNLFGGKETAQKVITAPVNGRAIPMSEVSDPTFSQEILGKGTAVIPSDGRVVAPADGTIGMVFDTKHAVSLTTEFGAELIIHIGLDTVQLNGEHYTAHVSAGDKVKKGQLLIEFDLEKIKEAGYDVVTPVIVCNTPDFPSINCLNGMDVTAGETVIITL